MTGPTNQCPKCGRNYPHPSTMTNGWGCLVCTRQRERHIAKALKAFNTAGAVT